MTSYRALKDSDRQGKHLGVSYYIQISLVAEGPTKAGPYGTPYGTAFAKCEGVIPQKGRCKVRIDSTKKFKSEVEAGKDVEARMKKHIEQQVAKHQH